MHSQLIILLLATITSVANCQSFPDEASLPGCGQTCLDSVVNEASTFGCSDGSAGCLCAVSNFQNGVLNCASAACAADLYPSVTNYLSGVCATAAATGAATSVAPAATSVAVSTPLPVASVPATSVPATSVLATSVPATSVPAALSPSSILVSATSSFIDAAAPTSTMGPTVSQGAFASSTITSGFPSNTTLPTASTLIPSSSSTGAAGGALASASSSQSFLGAGATAAATSSTSQTSSTASSTPASATGLSAGAKAGIGIGAAIGAVAAIAAIVACVITRKHKSRQQQPDFRYDISEPMPGAGRVYANDNSSQGFDPVSELEMKSHRYEDMLPRQVPRNMV